MSLRLVFMGTPDFSVPALEALNEKYDIVGVYTQPDKKVGRGQKLTASPVKKKALEFDLPVFQPEKLSTEFEELSALKPDVIVVVAYGQILKQNVIDLAPLGCINIHSSLLPRWRGAAPIQRAILGGDQETGITTMFIEKKLDAGDILLQEKCPIGPDDTAGDVHDRLMEIGARLIIETVEGLKNNAVSREVQDESLVTHADKLTKDMERLNWNEPASEIDRQVRALNPWPGTSLYLESGERLRVKKAKLRHDIQRSAGEIFEHAGMLLLSTQEGSIELLSLQWDGKKPVDSAGFINGLSGRGLALPVRLKA